MRCYFQIVERGVGIRLGPQANFSRVSEGLLPSTSTRSSCHSPGVTVRLTPANWLRRPLTK
jgi:hypothetical protein